MRYGIGIDTGGTFTDSVLVDIETKEIKAFAKHPTTHHDLKEGIEACLATLFNEISIEKENVEVIGVSSTLATNAVVENKGGEVALFIIGLEKHMELPVAGFKFIKGGHDVYGKEVEPLDIEPLLDGVAFFRGRVDSYAVVSSMSFANPTHELVAKKAINMLDQSPVYISSDVSSVPGMEERAATTVLNARLMPVMENFINGLKTSVSKYADIKNLKIIDGEGSFLDFDHAVERSVKTFGSGPASTAFFGAALKGNALVIDIGGTTTDILLVEDSKPVIDSQSKIGDLETHVKSVRMKTIGLGGDSKVGVDLRHNLSIGPQRVESLCFSNGKPFPEEWMTIPGDDVLFFLRSKNIRDDKDFLKFFDDDTYLTMSGFFEKAGKGERTREIVKDYIRKGGFGAVGFTPTDALAVLGRIEAPCAELSVSAAKIISKYFGMDYISFCEHVVSEFEDKIVDAVVDFLVRFSSGKSIKEIFPKWRENKYLSLSFGSKFPIIGSGVAAGYFLEGVAKKLNSQLILPDYYEVGNAAGALNIVLKDYK